MSLRFRDLSGPTSQSARTASQVESGNAKAEQGSAVVEQYQCPNPPLAPLDHKVMSKAERRRAAKNEQPATKEEREQARERLQELRRQQRQMKKLGWRSKLRKDRGEAAVRRERAEVQEDAADFDEDEARVMAERMGGPRNRTVVAREGVKARSNNSNAEISSTNALKKRRVDNEQW